MTDIILAILQFIGPVLARLIEDLLKPASGAATGASTDEKITNLFAGARGRLWFWDWRRTLLRRVEAECHKRAADIDAAVTSKKTVPLLPDTVEADILRSCGLL